jgi:HEAT repeat protein
MRSYVSKKIALEDRIEQLFTIVAQGGPSQRLAALDKALKDKSNFLVAKAASAAAETLSYDLIPILISAYHRFLDHPLKTDKTCAAKRALARALYELDYDDPKFYSQGLRYQQLEPVWGGSVDTAVEIRGTCAMGLLAFGGPRAMIELVDAVHDPEPQVRIDVLKAMEMAQPYQAELVLRHTIQYGDAVSEVIHQAFVTLIKVAPETSLEFIANYLNHQQEVVCEAAALALGESRLKTALDVLITTSQERNEAEPFQHTLLKAIALQRHQEGYDYLLVVAKTSSTVMAHHAIRALAIYSYNDELRTAVQTIVNQRDEVRLKKTFDDDWQ